MRPHHASSSHLEQAARSLAAWLVNQRWFGGKGRPIRDVVFVDHVMVGEQSVPVLLGLVDVVYDAGPPERYFLPLAPWPIVGDALADPVACRALLAAVEHRDRLMTAHGGEVRFERGPAFAALAPSEDEASVRSLGAEQSNSSVVFADRLLLKCFRRVYDGPNPDLEVPRFLTTRTAFDRLPRLAGFGEYRGPGGTAASLAILQEFVVNQGDGWEFTLRTLAEGRGRAPAYLDEVRALGSLTAGLHLALASDPLDPDFAPEPVEVDDLAAWRDGALERLRSAEATLRQAEPGLGPAARTLAARALAGWPELASRVDALGLVRPNAFMKTRYHGDYHLGQVLKVADGWLVLDFEGEPLRSLDERRARACPLKDVAGMLRSFNYARGAAARQPGSPPLPALAAWEREARAQYLRAYFQRCGPAAPFLPADADAVDMLLGVFELEKAAYELEYELRNRPDWVELPLGYLAGLVG